MKNFYIASSLVALMLAAGSCSNDYDIYPEEYSKVAMIKDSGAHTLTVYSTAEIVEYPVTVLKGGYSVDAPMTATLRAMTQEEFDEYISESGSPYSYLPQNCYRIGDGTSVQVNFNGDQAYHTENVNILPRVITTYMESYTDTQRTPVIPMVIETSDGTINKDNSKDFILIDLRVTRIFMGDQEPGDRFIMQDVGASTGMTEITIPVTLPVENEWGFDAVIEFDPSLITDNGYTYSAIAMDAVSGLQGTTTTLNFPKGTSTVNLNLSIDNSKIGGTPAVLPLRLKSTTLEGVEIEANRSTICYALFYLPRLAITADMVATQDEMPGDGQGIAGLIDDDPTTFFHSRWDTGGYHDETFGSWLWYTLKDPVQTIAFDFYARHNNANGRPVRVALWYQTSDGGFAKFATIDKMTDQLTGAGASAYYGPFTAPEPFTQFIFAVEEAVSGSLMQTGSATFWATGGIHFFGGM